jgi:hypothetical protein
LEESFRSDLLKYLKHRECSRSQSIHETKLRRDNAFHKCGQDPRNILTGRIKVKAFESFENLLEYEESVSSEGKI